MLSIESHLRKGPHRAKCRSLHHHRPHAGQNWPACEDEDSDIGVKLTVSFKLTVSLKTVSDDGSEQLGCFSFLLTHVLSLCRRGLASYYSQLLQLGIFPAVFKPQTAGEFCGVPCPGTLYGRWGVREDKSGRGSLASLR